MTTAPDALHAETHPEPHPASHSEPHREPHPAPHADLRLELRWALALASLPGVGAVSARRLRQKMGSFAAAFASAGAEAGEREAEAAQRNADSVAARCAALGISAIPFEGEGYPESLAVLEDPPVVLFAVGDISIASRAAVALVGARHATPYGRRVVRDIAQRLAAHHIVVVSGLAAGIDAEAHAATLDARGATIAVLGTGLDVSYPLSNDRLQRRVAHEGLLLSELPPGRRAHAGAFPRRNRIIAALSDVVVVVEAGARSGALITAQVGVSAGRVVAAVPGPIDAPQSEGANRLLRDGAQAISSVDDVMGLVALSARGRVALSTPSRTCGAPGMQLAGGPVGGATASSNGEAAWVPPAAPPFDALAPDQRVLAVLASGARTPDELVLACAASPRDVAVALATLTVRGAIGIDAAGLAYRVDRASWPSP